GNATCPDRFAYSRQLLEQKRGVMLMPTAAIQRNGAGAYVFVVNTDATVSIRNIELGATNGDETEVMKGLQPGDEVVLTGVDKLAEGTKVAAQPDQTGPGGTRGHGK